ncbi:hypothetical protein CRG98_022519 [Punica granatum]|uniref:RRM domain-containing protein n=1 Tax=Punica granatum TaxID=22663 RepID=A0A2I0JL36_PUNGR|nr:hypothetical protein CRG98_022519 [Punica granatum]
MPLFIRFSLSPSLSPRALSPLSPHRLSSSASPFVPLPPLPSLTFDGPLLLGVEKRWKRGKWRVADAGGSRRRRGSEETVDGEGWRDSACIEMDIVWHGLKLNCTAKMIQRTAISSPHSGEAYVIFKTKEAAERALKKLDEGCLLLPNGRPLVGCIGDRSFPGKQRTFHGHLVFASPRHPHNREKEAASSHCSQPNTVEFELAIDWFLLQERWDRAWQLLFKLLISCAAEPLRFWSPEEPLPGTTSFLPCQKRSQLQLNCWVTIFYVHRAEYGELGIRVSCPSRGWRKCRRKKNIGEGEGRYGLSARPPSCSLGSSTTLIRARWSPREVDNHRNGNLLSLHVCYSLFPI